MTTNNRSRRLKLLGASSVVTIAATVGLAQAATIILPGTASTGQSGASTQLIINTQSLANAALRASYTPGAASTGSLTTIGIETAVGTTAEQAARTESLVVDDNRVLATATANTGISTIQVSQANNVLNGANAGIAVGSSQSVEGLDAASSITQARVGLGLTGGVLPPASGLSLDQNTVAAAATGNSSTNAVAGIVPTTASPGIVSSVTTNTFGSQATAGVVVANDQRASVTEGLRSNVGGSTVGVFASVDAATNSAITASANSIDASSQVNSTQNFVRFNPTTVVAPAQAGGVSTVQTGAPSLDGVSVAVANNQTATGTARISSNVENSDVLVTVTRTVTDSALFAGDVAATGNRISAAAGVNSSALNGIRIDGLSVDGASAGPTGGAIAGALTSSFNRDLAVVNSQTASGRSPVDALVAGSDVRIDIDGTSGSVTSADNLLSASSTGNEALDNRIEFDGRSFAATAAVTNNQSNAASQSSRAENSSVLINGGNVANGSVALRGNRVVSAASGNSASNAVDVTAFSVEVPPGGVASLGEATVVGALIGLNQPVSSAGLGVLSNQSNSASANAQATRTTIGAGLGAIADGSATVAGNTVDVSASGNIADNSLALDTFSFGPSSGTALPLNINSAVLASLGTLSVQSNTGSTNALGRDNAIGLSVAGATPGSDLSVTGNAIRTAGTGNSNASLLFGGFGANGAAQEGQTFAFDGSAALRSDQTNSGPENVGQQFRNSIGIQLTGGGSDNLAGSSIAVSDNALEAAATGNASSNRIFLNGFSVANSAVGGLPSGSGYIAFPGIDVIGSVADLSAISRQANSAFENAVNRNSTIGLSAAGSSLTDGSAQIGGNRIGADSSGNMATNVVAVAGTDGAPAQSVSAAAVAASSQVNNAFLGSLSEVDGATIGMTLSGVVDAAVGVLGNAIESNAVGNSATNAVQISAFEINGTRNAGLFNLPDVTSGAVGVTQASFAAVNRQDNASLLTTASLSNARIAIDAAGGNSDSDLSVSNNLARASALGNSATNSVQLTAGSTLTNPSASILNGQTSTVSSNATASGVATGLTSAGGLGNAASVGGNTLTALAGGNSASNTLSASSFSQSGGLVGGIAASDGTTRSPFAITSVQLNGGGHVAAINNATIGVVSTGLSGGGSQRVGGNSIAAVGVANEAVNRIALNTAGRSSYGGAAINNVQTNLSGGNVTSTVTGARIGVASQFGSGLSSAVTGNTVSASATGNSAVNSIGGSVGSFYGSSR
ncbi:hypothetical protein [Aureimonas sp. ME7]|uniref:beta strand repeat-containing protein n=1 Tax=Aureimonas sp. ME7 TaxID=2744252 RepID=UPI0015F509AD|nr:hypothetical protein [Aureimonas sp. ME7]